MPGNGPSEFLFCFPYLVWFIISKCLKFLRYSVVSVKQVNAYFYNVFLYLIRLQEKISLILVFTDSDCVSPFPPSNNGHFRGGRGFAVR